MVRGAALRGLAAGRGALGAAKPTVLSNKDGFQFERIAALRPDLIIGTNAGIKRAD